jgi:hypothetical protein
VRVGQATFFCCSARSLHQSYSVLISTSSKTGNSFLYRHLALPPSEEPRTTPMSPDLHWLDALIAEVSQHLNGPILRRSEKHQVHRGVITRKSLLQYTQYHGFHGGFLCATSRIYCTSRRAGQARPNRRNGGQDTYIVVFFSW